MVGTAVLDTVLIRPVKENDAARVRGCAALQPLAFVLEPVYPVSADSELKITMDIKEFARLRGANADKLGDLDEVQCRAHTLYPAGETLPAPVRLAAHISKLGFGNLHQLMIGVIHDCREVLRVKVSTEHSVDLGNKLLICLTVRKTPGQLCHKPRLLCLL